MVAKNRPFWVIVAGATPTAFRSRYRDELLPTFRQLQRTQPDVALMWFERGRLWPSAKDAREALLAVRKARAERQADRGADWRPGGSHKDPRARFQVSRDEKRARFKRRLQDNRRPDGAQARGPSGRPDSSTGRQRPAVGPGRRPDNRSAGPGAGGSARPGRWKRDAAKPGSTGGKAKSGPPRRYSSKPRDPRRPGPKKK
jgi:hypothetical protein